MARRKRTDVEVFFLARKKIQKWTLERDAKLIIGESGFANRYESQNVKWADCVTSCRIRGYFKVRHRRWLLFERHSISAHVLVSFPTLVNPRKPPKTASVLTTVGGHLPIASLIIAQLEPTFRGACAKKYDAVDVESEPGAGTDHTISHLFHRPDDRNILLPVAQLIRRCQFQRTNEE